MGANDKLTERLATGCKVLSKRMAEVSAIIPGREFRLITALSATNAPSEVIPAGVASPPEYYLRANVRGAANYKPLNLYYNRGIRVRLVRLADDETGTGEVSDKDLALRHANWVVDVALRDLVQASASAKVYFEDVFDVDNINTVLDVQRNFVLSIGKETAKAQMRERASTFTHIGTW